MNKKEAKEQANIEFEDLVIKLLPISNSINDLCKKLGIRPVDGYYRKIKKIIEKNNLSTEHFGTFIIRKNYRFNSNGKFVKMTDKEFFSDNSNRTGYSLLKRLIDGGYRHYCCEDCGLDEWNGKPIKLQVHHINGNHYDNRLENLQILCPNCHSQTDTYARKNKQTNNRSFLVSKRSEEILKKQDSTFKPDFNEPILKEIKYCQYCGKEIHGDGNKYCSQECSHSANIKLSVDKETLIEDFKTLKSYMAVGRKYGVSDNAIRKRCIKLCIYNEIQDLIKHR